MKENYVYPPRFASEKLRNTLLTSQLMPVSVCCVHVCRYYVALSAARAEIVKHQEERTKAAAEMERLQAKLDR